MQNKVLKIITIINIFIIISSIFPSNVVHSTWVDDANGFLSSADPNIQVDKNKLKDASDSIYNVVSSIGMIASVIVGIILGIKFMMASAEDKADVKQGLMPYVIGCIVVFGAFGIWKILVNTFGGI